MLGLDCFMANTINAVNNHLQHFLIFKCHCWSVLFESTQGRNLGIGFLYLLS